jgi:hypothetical protein
MSLTHKALQSNSPANENYSHHPFNPLAAPPKNASRLPLYIIGFVIMLLSVVIVLWPKTTAHQSLSVPGQALEPIAQTTTAKQQPSAEAKTRAKPKPEQATRKSASVEVATTIATALKAQTAPEPAAQAPVLKNSTTPKTESVKIIMTDSKPKEQATATEPLQPQPITEKTNRPETETKDSSTVAASPGIRQSINQWQQQVGRLIEQGEVERAEAVLKNWIVTVPNDPQPRIWLARIYINNQVYRTAEPLISELKATEAKALLGVIYERTSRPTQAALLFEELYRNNPTNHRWLLFWAINSENSGKLANASTLYQTYLNQFSSQDAQLTTFVQQRLRSIQEQ